MMIAIIQVLGLQITPVPNNGYYPENLGKAKLFSHNHNHILSIDLIKIKNILDDSLIENKIGNAILNRAIYDQYLHLYNTTLGNFNKLLKSERKRRGLVNVLGSVIKSITGNMDDKDRVLLEKHISEIENKQFEIIEKMNKDITVANDNNKRYNELVDKINHNSLETRNLIVQTADLFKHFIMIQLEINNLNDLNDFIKTLMRSISLATKGITNIELFTANEIIKLENSLINTYGSDTLTHDKLHPFELIEYSKSYIVTTKSQLLIMIKIPIFMNGAFQLSKIYPVQNTDGNILLPPTDYYGANKWLLNCEQRDEQYSCEKTVQSQCELPGLENCVVVASNNFILYELSNGILLNGKNVEIKENCNGSVKTALAVNTNLIQSNCLVYIRDKIYSVKSNSEIEIPKMIKIKMQPSAHLSQAPLQKLTEIHQIEPIQPLHLKPIFVSSVGWSGIIMTLISIIIVLYYIIRKRNRIKTVFFKPKLTIDEAEKELKDLRGRKYLLRGEV